MNEADLVLTYGTLLTDPPEGWAVARHAAFDANGVLVIDAPGLEGIVVKPDQQLNYRCDDEGHVVAYSCGPLETPKSEQPEPEPEPEPEPDDTKKAVEEAIADADAHLAKQQAPAKGKRK